MSKKVILFRTVALITLLAGVLRYYAARNLYGDNDETTYMTTSVGYASFLRAGDYQGVIDYDLTNEHPALNKILFGAALLIRRPIDTFSNSQMPMDKPITTSDAAVWIITDRYLSVIFGTLAVMILAFLNPWAALFLGVHTLSVKYTSEIYLEALPLLTSLLCAATYLAWFNQIVGLSTESRRRDVWLVASAFFLGLTAASKYIYCVVGIAVGFHFILAVVQQQIALRFMLYMLGWGVGSVVIFFAFNPYLWSDSMARLMQTIEYHLNYSKSEHVVKSQYPFWQPLRWLFSFSRFYDLRPRSAFFFDLDTPIFLLAVLGLPRLFQQKRFYFYWLMITLVFLLVWNTKWPQYALIALIPLCVAASEGVLTAWNLGQRFLTRPQDPSS